MMSGKREKAGGCQMALRLHESHGGRQVSKHRCDAFTSLSAGTSTAGVTVTTGLVVCGRGVKYYGTRALRVVGGCWNDAKDLRLWGVDFTAYELPLTLAARRHMSLRSS